MPPFNVKTIFLPARGGWTIAEQDVHHWRRRPIAKALAETGDVVIVSHFIAIIVLAGVALFPALSVTIASALRGSGEERRLRDGQAPQTLQIDINFNELIEPIALNAVGELDGYSLVEVIAEKLRALLQQKTRNRFRRQDVYDIAYLLERFPPDDEERAEILRMLRLTAEARDITPDIDSLSDPEIAERAGQAWETMQQEPEEPLPDFGERFALVEAFYRSLPWDAAQQ